MSQLQSPDVERVLGLLPSVSCVLTSAFEHRRGGVLVKRAMQCADEPLCIAVAVPTGHRIATLVRDSHTFALCLLDKASRLLVRKFDGREEGDPFDTLETLRLVSTAPIPARALAAIDCEVVRHYDLEADHEVYIGQVLAVRALHLPVPVETVEPGGHQALTNGAHANGVHAPSPAPTPAPIIPPTQAAAA
ncbi:MAG: flavin reductase [Phycisphaeraceae bacterium]|nr:flavin reductase [Phycisphaeraceae bacterium]